MTKGDLQNQSPDAFTEPVENAGFQFTSRLEPLPAQPVPTEKKRSAVPVIIAVLILLAVASAVCAAFLRFSLTVQRNEHGFSLALVRRSPRSARMLTELPLPTAAPEFSAPPAQNSEYEWSGAMMRFSTASQDDSLSYAQLYSLCAPSLGILEAADDSGRVRKGTVIVLTEDGALIACTHLVSGAESLRVTLNGTEYDAYLVGLDYATDLAVLKIEAENLEAATFCGDASARPGDAIAVIGDPVGGVIGIRDGILSAVNPDYSYRGFPLEVLQVGMELGDIASGSALVNASGQIIGILDHDLSAQLSDASGVAMAASMACLRPVIDELLQNGCVAGRPSSGLAVSELPAAYAAYYEYPSCLYISSVETGSTAEAAGLRRGDLILAANGTAVESVGDLYAVINGLRAGDILTLTICRDRESSEVSFALMEAARTK